MFWKYIGVSLFATIKFIFAPLLALKIEGNTWLYTYIAVVIGGLVSASFFYFFSVYFINRSLERRIRKGIKRRNFTRVNKLIVKTRNKIGVVGLSLLAASFISIPLGSIITAKFYRHKKSTIFILYSCVLFSGVVFTSITYLFSN